ncbi:MAG: hypothetical protein DMF06_04900 [Verrucomicrobia bacterium]|nr:MAG: hypothetical protein DMF06_04900 [Verrucomicrobiota bacterium]
MSKHPENLSRILERDLGVSPEYRHGPKRVTFGEILETSGSVLKWYAVYREDQPVPDAISALARAYLTKTRLDDSGLGFVILHRCGSDFYFLIVCTWRGSNEIWETVFYKDGDAMADFALFPREKTHKPTFCVWELAPVWHEKKAWVRFLESARDEEAGQLWLADRYAGAA